MAQKIKLTIAIGDNSHVAALKEGRIKPEGIDLEFVNVVPQIAAFRRMVRGHEFDICELAPTTYFIARALGAPFVALPIFLMRHFHHNGILIREDAGIERPKDLEGKRMGVRAYSVTTGVWVRGLLQDEFGVDHSKITWVVDDEEHVRELVLPPNVVHTREGESLSEMMASGAIQAGLAGNAGVGRAGSPTGGTWKQVEANYPELFPNAHEMETEWYRRTGIYPIHGTIVVKDKVLAEHPWVARALFDAFTEAKREWLPKLHSGEAASAKDKWYREQSRIVGEDPLPYGMKLNMPTIKALQNTAHKQGLTPELLPIERAFEDPEG
jgi:4,5-dihydroxyphthalate decarboxylase